MDQVNGSRVAEIIRQRRQAYKVSNATIKRDLVALSSMLNYAIAQGWVEANPVLPRMRLVKERRDPIMLPDQSHIQMVIDRAPDPSGSTICATVTPSIGCRQAARSTTCSSA